MAQKQVKKANDRFLSYHFTPTKNKHKLLYVAEEQPNTSSSTKTTSDIIRQNLLLERELKKEKKKIRQLKKEVAWNTEELRNVRLELAGKT